MRLVYLESPYAGGTPEEIEENVRYARACMADCLRRGEAPFASHLLYTQPGVLRDEVKEERKLGMTAGFEWSKQAALTVVYTDRGITEGMKRGIELASGLCRAIEFRTLEGTDPVR